MALHELHALAHDAAHELHGPVNAVSEALRVFHSSPHEPAHERPPSVSPPLPGPVHECHPSVHEVHAAAHEVHEAPHELHAAFHAPVHELHASAHEAVH